MIIDVWRPIFKGSGKMKKIIEYIQYDIELFYKLKQKGYIIRYLCDRCASSKVYNTTSSTFFDKNVVYNTIDNQICRSCRSKISEYAIKKTQIPFDQVKNSFISFKYKLITNELEYDISENKSQLRLISICSNNHEYTCTWNNWKSGKRCGKCYELNKRENSIKYKFGFELYKYLVVSNSNKNYNLYKGSINVNNYKRSINEYHLDHIYSIYDGFINNVPIYLISSIYNLRLINCSKNLSKNKRSDITLDELCSMYFSSLEINKF